jgi:putative hydrolase of the HAD superfamily
VRALLIDLDDTLLDYSGGVDGCWAAACAAAAPPEVDRQALLDALVTTRAWFWSDPGRHRSARVDMPRAWTAIAAHALARCGAGATAAPAIAEAFAARRRARMRLFPDARGCLERLRGRGLPLGLVTNGDAREQRDKIERHDLARYFDVILIEGELGVGKPEAAVYRAALDALGAPAAATWMVGDHLEFDVAGPQRLGLRGVWLDRRGQGLPSGTAVRPDRIIRGLDELGSHAP